MDATVFFDNVLVPWERVFLLGDVDLCNNVGAATQSMAHRHQVLTRYVVKAEFILGLADLMVETLGSGSILHVQEQVAELITHRDMLHACLRAAEVDAAPNQWGIMSPASAPLQAGRALFGRTVYPRMVEIIQLLGTSSPWPCPPRPISRLRWRQPWSITWPPTPPRRATGRSCFTSRGMSRAAPLQPAGVVRAHVWGQRGAQCHDVVSHLQ